MQVIARRLRVPVAESTLLAEHYAQVDRRIASRVFFQGPMWIGWTRPKIVRVINVLNRVPLISLAGDFISGYLPLVDDYFCELTRVSADIRYDHVDAPVLPVTYAFDVQLSHHNLTHQP